MRVALASTAFLIFAAASLPVASQPTGAPATQSSTASTTTTTTSTVRATPLSKAEAKDQMRDNGYRNVHALLKGRDGVWHAKATKDGRPCDVALDLLGNITTS